MASIFLFHFVLSPSSRPRPLALYISAEIVTKTDDLRKRGKRGGIESSPALDEIGGRRGKGRAVERY